MAEKYRINEIFLSLQGEGTRAGTANIFIRFSGCNFTCKKETHGFDCDTEFVSGRDLTINEIIQECRELSQKCKWIIFTGGEPALQVDNQLINSLHNAGYYLAIETNGSIKLPDGLDFITVSPKSAEHTIRQLSAYEVKYVRCKGQGIPKPACQALYKLISPAFDGNMLDRRNLEWCVKLVLENPEWRLSLQQHKFMRIR